MNKELDFKLIESDWLLINFKCSNTKKPKIIVFKHITRNKKKKKNIRPKKCLY
jgi:hypothetical protein